jgi:luciferase family oxidoreductase group 1
MIRGFDPELLNIQFERNGWQGNCRPCTMNKQLADIPLSVLDLATVIEGDTSHGDALKRSVALAQHAERLGYRRYWFAEHHNMETVASSATSVLIGHIAGHTNTIRVGSGGVMLPNHAPLVIAEQFGTLASIYPGRIDLGLGRAPGTDPVTSHALRRSMKSNVDEFPNDVIELLNYLGPKDPTARVRAIPGEGTEVPVWLLGSSTYSAQLAGMLGLPFAFAAHFAPTHLMDALQVYRSYFKASKFLEAPYAMACVNVIAAGTEEEANMLATSFYHLILGLIRNDRKPLPPPVPSMDGIWTEREQLGVLQMTEYSFTGDAPGVKKKLQAFLDKTDVDEIMITSHIYDQDARLRSYELLR